MLCNVTGVLQDLNGDVLASTKVQFSREAVLGQNGATVSPAMVETTSDESGQVDVDLHPGDYTVVVVGSQRGYRFSAGVPDEASAVLNELIEQAAGAITPDEVADARAARDAALAAQGVAEGAADTAVDAAAAALASQNAAAGSATSASGSASTATTKASEASTSAGTASTAASTATTQAGTATSAAATATAQAAIATTQAGTATTQAGLSTTARAGAEAAQDAAELAASEAEASALAALDAKVAVEALEVGNIHNLIEESVLHPELLIAGFRDWFFTGIWQEEVPTA